MLKIHFMGRLFRRKKATASVRLQDEGSHSGAEAHNSVDDAHTVPSTSAPVSCSDERWASGRMWERAYDNLKNRESDLIASYERILLLVLESGAITLGKDMPMSDRLLSVIQITQQSIVRKDGPEILRNIEVEAAASVIVGHMPPMDAHSPDLLPWAALCSSLSVLHGSRNCSTNNVSGILYIATKMEWYLALVSTVAPNFSQDHEYATDLREDLEKRLIALFEALLLLQIKTVVVHRGSSPFSLAHRLRIEHDEHDDWSEQLYRIKHLEEDFTRQGLAAMQATSMMYRIEAVQQRSSVLGKIEKSMEDARMRQMGEKRIQVLQTLQPNDQRELIQSIPKMLPGTGDWILKSPDFQQWLQKDRAILWIQADPGMGKTVLMASIFRSELQGVTFKDTTAIFFFCKYDSDTSNNVAGVLRNLIYQLALRKVDLIPHILEAYDVHGPAIADMPGSLASLLCVMLDDPILGNACLVVDALDECSDDAMPILLGVMDHTTRGTDFRVQWLVTSRYRMNGRRLVQNSDAVEMQFVPYEANKEVSSLTHHSLALLGPWDLEPKREQQLKESIQKHVLSRKDISCPYVSLIFRILGKLRTPADISEYLNKHAEPSTFHEFLNYHMAKIDSLDSEAKERCHFVLSAVVVAHRPLQLPEVALLAGLEERSTSEAKIRTTIEDCNPFLIIQDDAIQRNSDVTTDFLQRRLLLSGSQSIHFRLFSNSVQAMSQVLVQAVRASSSVAATEDSDQITKLLSPIHYSCVHWINHLCAALGSSYNHQMVVSVCRDVMSFLSVHLLHWLESLSHLNSLSEGLRAINRLLKKLKEMGCTDQDLVSLLQDTEILIGASFSGVYQYPEQIYGAPLIFSPPTNRIQTLFSTQRLPFVRHVSATRPHFDGCLKVLEGHKAAVQSVAFSPTDNSILSGSSDHTIIHWDISAGVRLKKHGEHHSGAVLSVAFMPVGQDSQQMIASASSDKTVQIMNIDDEEPLTTIKSQSIIKVVAFSPTEHKFAYVSRQPAVHLFDVDSGRSVWPRERDDFDCPVNGIDISPDGNLIALALHDGTIQIRDACTGEISASQTRAGHSSHVFAVAFSRNGKHFASASHDKRVILWDLSDAAFKKPLDGHSSAVFDVAFSPNGKYLVSASSDKTVRVWNAVTGGSIGILDGHRDWVNSVSFSTDGRLLATASHDRTIRVWDVDIISNPRELPSIDDHSHMAAVKAVTFSSDGRLLASLSSDKKVKLWDSATRNLICTFVGHHGNVLSVAFSPGNSMLASASSDKTVMIWKVAKDEEPRTLKGHTRQVNAVVFSADGKILASGSNDNTVRIWNVATGHCEFTLVGHTDWVTAVAFSQNGLIAAAARDKVICVWQVPVLYEAKPDSAAKTEQQRTRLNTSQFATALSLSDDGNHVRACGEWFDTSTGERSNLPLPDEPDLRTRVKDDWIIRDGKKVLWLPLDYRPTCSTQHGDLHAFGLASGRVIFLEFDWLER